MQEEINNTEDQNLDDPNVELTLQNYIKSHTPWRRIDRKINRNEICPLCDSGKKFKNCECYKTYKLSPKYTINYGKGLTT
jgi:uncharacterized protein YecA (UPF0149 family)